VPIVIYREIQITRQIISTRNKVFPLLARSDIIENRCSIRPGASELIYWGQTTPCSYVLTSNHRPHSPRFYFLFGNNHVASSSLPLSSNSQPRVSIPPVSLFRFPCNGERGITCHRFLHMFHLCAASEPASRNDPRQNQGLYPRTYSITQWKNK